MERKRLGEILIDENIITQDQLELALKEQKESGLRLGEYLTEKLFVSEEQIISSLIKQLNISYIDLSKQDISQSILKHIPEKMIKTYKIIPFDIINGQLLIAMQDPLNYFAIDEIKRVVKLNIKTLITSKKAINEAIEKYFGKSEAHQAAQEFSNLNFNDTSSNTKDIDVSSSSPSVRFLNKIVEMGITKSASDIHIEPENETIRIRYRIDGHLVTEMEVDKGIHESLLSIVKQKSGMNIIEKRLPQDGSWSHKLKGKEIDLRASTLPLNKGEKIVIRILDKSSFEFKKENLGLSLSQLEIYNDLLKSLTGVILVTGETGSGKTTTLYTTITELTDDSKNIITLEDPVEYDFKGINQVSINPKIDLTFAKGLRSVLRQDPDIIMVGEIRDSETVKIAIESALTGHLVLSSIHTNNALETVTRLLEMGVEPFLIASTLNGIISQKLIRKICPNCKTSYEASYREKELLGIDVSEKLMISKGEGCGFCRNTGYKGRVAIFEILKIDKNIQKAISEHDNIYDIKKIVKENGFVDLIESCKLKVIEDITSIEEYLRISCL